MKNWRQLFVEKSNVLNKKLFHICCGCKWIIKEKIVDFYVSWFIASWKVIFFQLSTDAYDVIVKALLDSASTSNPVCYHNCRICHIFNVQKNLVLWKHGVPICSIIKIRNLPNYSRISKTVTLEINSSYKRKGMVYISWIFAKIKISLGSWTC